MKNPAYTTVRRERLSREFFRNEDFAVRQGILKLLAIKDSDIRLLNLEQSRDAVDKGLHAGGAFSSIIPLVALFYGGFIHLDIEDPTRRGNHRPRSRTSSRHDSARRNPASCQESESQDT